MKNYLVLLMVLWTALSFTLGIDIRGDIIHGVPCVQRNHQLFCPTAGSSYPIERIERFIDDNKALMGRMFGDFEMVAQYGPPLQRTKKRKRNTDGKDVYAPGVPDFIGPIDAGPEPLHDGPPSDTYFGKWRSKRQNNNSQGGFSRAGGLRPSLVPPPGPQNLPNNSGKIDTCESKIEILTPYWAMNSASKVRVIVNTQHFEQAIHQEVCTKQNTSRCSKDCSCEQKYKWHRLLAYDPEDDCKGIFMDWFLFPICCVCRCVKSN